MYPFSLYKYKVESVNSVGSTKSAWSISVRSGEAPPTGVPPPTFEDITAHSVKVVAGEPKINNGRLRHYNLYMKANTSAAALREVISV